MIPPIPADDTTLVLRRTFAASRPRVFHAWIEPEALEQWWRPMGLRATVSKLEAYVGGSFRFDAENGSFIAGTYLQFDPPQKRVFTWTGSATQQQETIVTLDFFDRGTATEIVLTHERLNTTEMRRLLGTGWQSLLDALSAFLFPLSRSH